MSTFARRSRLRPFRLAVSLVVCLVAGAPWPAVAEATRAGTELGLPPEQPDDPPGIPAKPSAADKAGTIVSFGRFTHIQVNVSGSGTNITGDAANEPSIAVHPVDHDIMAIGWRQFDTIASNFRQAGYGYTTDGGLTWTTGKIQPGAFRSDPVLAFDADGDFFYNSLMGDLTTQVFPSSNGGMTWGASVFANGGDHSYYHDRADGRWGSYILDEVIPAAARVLAIRYSASRR